MERIVSGSGPAGDRRPAPWPAAVGAVRPNISPRRRTIRADEPTRRRWDERAGRRAPFDPRLRRDQVVSRSVNGECLVRLARAGLLRIAGRRTRTQARCRFGAGCSRALSTQSNQPGGSREAPLGRRAGARADFTQQRMRALLRGVAGLRKRACPSAWPCEWRSRPSAPVRGCHRAPDPAPSAARAPRPYAPEGNQTR